MTTPPAGPPPRPDYEEMARATAAAITGAIVELVRILHAELEKLQDNAEAAVGRVKGAIVRSLHALQRAILDSVLAILFLTLGAIVLSIFLVAVLNKYLGDPWGTGLTALILLLTAAFFGLRARSNFQTMQREAEALTSRGRGRSRE